MNTMGVYYTPVTESLGILQGEFAMNSTISALVSGFFTLMIPKVLEMIGWKKAVGIGSILTAVSVFAMGLTTNIIGFNLLGITRGIGISLTAFVPGAALINQWFEEKNGLAISLATSFSGIAAIIFSPIFSRLVLSIGWQKSFYIHGILILLFSLPAMFYPFSFNPQDEGLLPYGARFILTSSVDAKSEDKRVAVSDYLGLAFIAFMLMAILQTSVSGMNQHLPGYGISLGLNPANAGLMLSGAMLGNMVFKLLAGMLIDRIGAIKTTVFMISLNIIAMLGLIFWMNPTVLIFNSWLYGAVFGTAVLHVVLCKEIFGLRIGNHVYSILVFATSIAFALSNVGLGFLFDFTGTYKSGFWLAIIFQMISFVFLFTAMKFAPNNSKAQPQISK